jgi:hypothetical protein
MNNEETKLINDELTKKNKAQKPSEKQKKSGSKAGMAAGAFVAGAATGFAANATESEFNSEELPQDTIEADATKSTETPASELSDPADNAEIKLDEEPNNVVTDDANTSATETINTEDIPSDEELISAEPIDNDIHVLGVEAVSDDDGNTMNVALLENNGDQALLVDVDNDGTIDVLLHDDNYDGILQETEIHDVSGAGIEVSDLAQIQDTPDDGTLYVSNDDMPDYINDADTTDFV